MTSISSGFSPVEAHHLSPARPGSAATETISESDLARLDAIANDPAATPVEQGNALREGDALRKNAETFGLTNANDNTVRRAAGVGGGSQTSRLYFTAQSSVSSAGVGGGSPTSRLRAPTGPDIAPARRNGVTNQLLKESRLNAGLQGDAASATYSKDLANSSNRVRHNNALFPAGTYRSLTPPGIVGVGKPPNLNDPNPLHVDRISPENSRRTIEALNTAISKRETVIKRLEELHSKPRYRGPYDELSDGTDALTVLRAQNTHDRASREFHIDNARLQSSLGENGKAYQAIATNAKPNATPVIFINGVNTDIYRSSAQALELSQELQVPVNHIVNVSSKGKLITGGAQVLGDTTQRLFNNLGDAPNVGDQRVQQLLTGNSEAAATAANAILDQLQNGTGKVRVIGYSQGAAIGTEALRKVNDILTRQGVSAQERKNLLGRVEFLGIGPGAADRHLSQAYQNGPNGPTIRNVKELNAVTYKTISDANDPIATLVNVSNADGSRTDRADPGKAASAIAQLGSGSKGILPHLSYFKTYQATDPGSIYNPEFSNALKLWYRGQGKENAIIHGANTGK